MPKCVICKNQFEKKRKDQVTCANQDCRRERARRIGKRWKRNHPEYMKNYMDMYNKL